MTSALELQQEIDFTVNALARIQDEAGRVNVPLHMVKDLLVTIAVSTETLDRLNADFPPDLLPLLSPEMKEIFDEV